MTTTGIDLATVYGAVMVVLCGAGLIWFLWLLAVAIVRDHRDAKMSAEFEGSAYQPPRVDAAAQCHVANCGQPFTHDVDGWRLCDDCWTELGMPQRSHVVFDAVYDQDADVINLFDRKAGGAA